MFSEIVPFYKREIFKYLKSQSPFYSDTEYKKLLHGYIVLCDCVILGEILYCAVCRGHRETHQGLTGICRLESHGRYLNILHTQYSVIRFIRNDSKRTDEGKGGGWPSVCSEM